MSGRAKPSDCPEMRRGRMPRGNTASRYSRSLLTLRPRRFELIALLPSHQLGQTRSFPSQGKAKPRHRRIPHEIHLRMIFITRLVIMLLDVVALLIESPGLGVPLVLH